MVNSTKEWITDTSKMWFTSSTKEMVDKVLDYTDTILYFNVKDGYKTVDPSETHVYPTQDELCEAFEYTYRELEKEGVFDEEEEAPADLWLEVLEDRVAEEDKKLEDCKESIKECIAEFKSWLNMTDDYEILCDIEFKASELVSLQNLFDTLCHRKRMAQGELAAYKKTMNY